ncbi:hypothetical protein H2684_02690 [Clostridium sp. cel8]|jgi:inner membrane protein involved in colicin E2 resistance|uniref:hypothetical protein n=1 Tax=unclassified Clostridium TaxID=2614128 RepID=UPI0015F3BCCD|nr:hypothetical protein [Clostridium sp. cel8]MBA5850222.1 hypothetical protein [Clostridium sp. cel8]
MIFLLIITFIIIIFIEVPNMIENKYWRELTTFFAFLLIAFVFSLFFILKIPLPNALHFVEYVIKDLLHLNYG